MYAFITIISYGAFLLLIMPTIKISVFETPILFILGVSLLLWKKPWKYRYTASQVSVLSAIAFSAYLGCCFYNRWHIGRIFRLVSAILPISEFFYSALINFFAICGTICAAHFCAVVFTQIKTYISEKPQSLKRKIMCCLIASFVTVMLSQIMIGIDIWSMGHLKFSCGVLIVSALVLTIYCFLRQITVSVVLGTGLFMLISTVNVYVYSFRGRLFVPIDLLSAGTVMNVVSNYNLLPSLPIIMIGWGIWLGVILYIAATCAKAKSEISFKQRGSLAVCCVSTIALLFFYAIGLPARYWDKQGAEGNGYILDYISKFKDLYVAAPDGYSQEQIYELSCQYTPDADISEESKDYPHIIVIMDESFSDLTVFGEIDTNLEVTSFISQLRNNAIHGYVLTSVYGGNTANSEYEFLTGNSMAWLAPDAVPYQQNITRPTYSMVSYLKSNYNYQCVAMHPFFSNGWNRPAVYAHLGFDQTCFLEDFPQKHYIRSYISDQEMFQTIVQAYESATEAPLFLFGVTMQNHGGYTYTGDDFDQSISLIGYKNDYPIVEQYLSLLHETDKAVEYLISYFEKSDDKVVIVFFGDHQPAIDDAFIEETAGSLTNSLDDQQKKYIVPFFIWANYDIDERYIEATSLNYLSSYVYDAAGIPQPPYNLFLSDLQNVIPAINAHGFYSIQSQSYIPFNMASDHEKTWLQMYAQLQYNSLFDGKNRSNVFFPTLD